MDQLPRVMDAVSNGPAVAGMGRAGPREAGCQQDLLGVVIEEGLRRPVLDLTWMIGSVAVAVGVDHERPDPLRRHPNLIWAPCKSPGRSAGPSTFRFASAIVDVSVATTAANNPSRRVIVVRCSTADLRCAVAVDGQWTCSGRRDQVSVAAQARARRVATKWSRES